MVDAPNARRIADAARDGEARDVIGDGDDQVLARGDGVVDEADEGVQEEAIVVVARRDQQRRALAELADGQSGEDVGAEQVRVEDVEVPVAQQRGESIQGERIDPARALSRCTGMPA